MGKRSVKDNKNIFQLSRENAGLTREAAAEKTGFISARRIESIENDIGSVHPDELRPLAECYGDPLLCNRYCATVCPVGRGSVAEITPKSLQEITVDVLASLSRLSAGKDRFVEIAEDGKVNPDEQEDFSRILENLNKMALAVETLRAWVSDMKTRIE